MNYQQITVARHPSTAIKTARGDVPWDIWLSSERTRLLAPGLTGQWRTVAAEAHGRGRIALWGDRRGKDEVEKRP